nr:prolyl 4-hydroxylase subunit alpha-2-like [Drosophila bipectinata]
MAKAHSLRPRMPTRTDYMESLYAIYRLQSTYDLDPAKMSGGLLRGKQYRSKKWSSLECLMVGTIYYLDENFENAEIWFQLALEKYYQHSIPKQFEVLGIPYRFVLILLMKSAKSSGRYDAALEYAKKGASLELHSNYWKDQMDQVKALIENPKVIEPFRPVKPIFKTACRKEYPHVHLKCRYLKNSAFLKLAPIKMEEVFLDPSINATGLSVKDSEMLQISNYGIGGHLVEHQDFTTTTEVSYKNA